MRLRAPAVAALAALFAVACSRADAPPGDDAPTAAVEPAPPAEPELCPASAPAPHPLPGISDNHRSLAYWLERTATFADLDEPLLDEAGIRALNRGLLEADIPLVRFELDGPLDPRVRASVDDRLAYVAGRFEEATYVQVDGSPVPEAWRQALNVPAGWDGPRELRVVTAPTQVRCAPVDASFYTPSLDLRFDRNNCSTLAPQEVVELLGTWPNGMRLARGTYTIGWLPPDAALSPPVPDAARATVLDAPRVRPIVPTEVAGQTLTPDTPVPLAEPGVGLVATSTSFERWALAGAATEPVAGPLTRRAVLAEAFRHLDEPYGWGGQEAGRDCSRFVMDIFARFGIELPRFSGHQALAGSYGIDVAEVDSEQEKLLLIDAAARRGVVLLHFPGHIMLYLGRDHEGRPMAIHSFAEYLEPCAEPPRDPSRAPETLREVDRVTVSDLELGRGTSRTAFVERLTRITVLGGTPGLELHGAADLRAAAPPRAPGADACPNDPAVFTVTTPRRPNAQQPLGLFATSSEQVGPLTMRFVAPDGTVHVPEVETWGATPYHWYAQLPDAPQVGTWTLWVGDDARVADCQQVTVTARRPEEGSSDGPVWENRNRWNEDIENLYAGFVERLFAYPLDEDLTWTSLHELVRNADRNLLYDYYGLGEDERIDMTPDCADLPYMLRAYFAWKVGVPFGYRACTRGRAGRPPRCRDLATNLQPRQRSGDVEAFEHFAQRAIRNGVHSASGRTHPDDDETDYYPVDLEREALRPGTLYADPYGHLLIIAGWQPQGVGTYGVLVGADAQPDRTVGRRRFWRGSFLFSPETTDVGAGFKAFRPVVVDGGEPRTLTNDELARTDEFARYALTQYEGTTDDFYERMETIINPRPLDPVARMHTLVDALDESVSRRVNSVDNGEAFIATQSSPVEMPTGYAIFETVGAWENYSTPSRDMRLLISIDTVVQFPDRVRRSPERYGIAPGDVGAAVAALEAELAESLAARSFRYTRSDGSPWTLTLADVAARAEAFEMAYNPNDCPEIRWAAPEGSEEYAPCDRNAPSAQRARMREYRPWFEDRQRPPR